MIGFNGGLIGKDRSTSASQSVPGVWTLREQLKAKRSFLWPSNAGEDPYYGNVSLLLKGNGTNGSTTIIDSSPSPKTVTAFGDAQISTAESKFGGTSIAFDGTGDYLTVPASSDFAFDADFTIEMWVKTSVFSLNVFYRRVVSTGPDNANAIQLLFFAGVASPNISVRSNTQLINGSISAATGNWVHIAVSRSGSQMRLFVDGTQSGSTASTSTNFSAGATYGFIVGRYQAGNGHFDGYIDDLRITKGIARYTSSFTPPGAL